MNDRSGLDLVTLLAATDVEFRRRLIANPHAAIEQAFRLRLSPALRIRFIEKEPDVDVLVVLPDLVAPPVRARPSVPRGK